MKIGKFKIKLEWVFLVVFLIVFLWMGCANLFDNKISHDFPYGYLASDPFLHANHAQGIKELGDGRVLPFYTNGFEDSINGFPPLFNYLVADFSILSGIEVYDLMYLFVFLFSALGIAILFLTVTYFNKNVAILSLPIMVLVFTKKFYTGFTWGQWDMYIGAFFLMGVVWSISRSKLEKSWILTGLFLTGAFLAHVVEAIWGIGFIGLYFLIELIVKRGSWDKFKKYILAGVVFVITSSAYLFFFLNSWFVERLITIKTVKKEYFINWGNYSVINFKEFGMWLIVPILIGVVLLFYYIKKKDNTALLFSGYMFIMGFTYLIRFDKALQTRFLWPIYISVLFGITLYMIISLVPVKSKRILSIVVASVILVLLFNFQYEPLNTSGIMHQDLWNSLTWIKDNTNEKDTVLFFYGDGYSQDDQTKNNKRLSYVIRGQAIIDAVQNRSIKRYYLTRMSKENPGSMLLYKKGFLEYGDHLKEADPLYFKGDMDICNFDYYVFDKYSRYEVLAQYSMIVKDLLLQNSGFEVVYENNFNVLLKNNNKGEDCIEPRQI
jgi:hypothetical protein